MAEVKSLVLRFARNDGDHVFRLAKLQPEAIENLSDQISKGARWENIDAFGPPLNLSEVMRQMDTRDFAVVDVRA